MASAANLTGADLLRQLDAETADLADSVRSSLVHISDVRRGAGAGTIWHEDGLIVTNAHVVGRNPRPQVTLPDGQTLTGRVLAMDTHNDIAAVMVEANGLPTIEIGDSMALTPGDWLLAMGHPWGVHAAITTGIVIGIGADLPELAATGREWLAVSLHLRPGHSGGPMADVTGKLVGINTLMTGPDVGVAVPVHVVKRFLKNALKETSTRIA